MKFWLSLLLLLSTLAIAAPGDDRVLAAREAFRSGARIKPGAQLEIMRGTHHQDEHHALEPWVEYWQLRQSLDDNNSDGVEEFLARQEGSYLAEKLRGDWLKMLGKRRQWEDFQREYAQLQAPDNELVCYALQTRLTLQRDALALEEARPMWFRVLDLPESCALANHPP